MTKISSETQKTLACLCGVCDCDQFDKNCAWNQYVDKQNPNEELMRRITVLIKKEIIRSKKNGKSK